MGNLSSSAPLCRIQPAGDSVHLVQLTDTHLCAQRGGTLLDMDTDRSLQLVIRQVLREREVIDGVLCTGDLSDRGYLQAYQRLIEYLQAFDAESFWLPGNHDDREQMAAAIAGQAHLCGEVRAANWQILMLNSQIPGEVGGELGAAEQERFESALQAAQEQGLYTLVCLHHQPVPVGSAWIDQQQLADAEQFWQTVDRHPGVRGVLWGHVHQQIDTWRGDVALMASPSTCVQFAPGSEQFKADAQPPGYRWLELKADGGIGTGISRVMDASFNVDLESGGYL
ncbi:3',5'-cyclic-AMP phosphodiesterase [Pseudohalioglobus sediminis]|uniref:3',5'-cyclic-AMP phosphodiesterase n=1 Tax=Pseudohalioglobus sediminis TaxID=2606449 RepID=A0A5B0WW90_9GAMM|nr:3',5'-cyclic-AMP phosphodiesterase [Pseudohalioglobus sediminis]KAA1190635.1 3',5'-cyclic-AMP phosphodiesterase [Pseudohalioglobus sediminis]